MSDPKTQAPPPTPRLPDQTTLSLILHEVRRGNERTTRIEEKIEDLQGQVDELSGRVARNSSAVKSVSNSDLSQEARLAETITWRAAADQRLAAIEAKTDAQTAMLEENTAATEKVEKAVTGLLADPRVKALGAIVWMLVTGWLASKGVNVR